MPSPEEMLQNLGPIGTQAGVLPGDGQPEGYGGAPAISQPPQRRDFSRTPSRRPATGRRLSEVFLKYSSEMDPNFLVSVTRIYPPSPRGGSGFLDEQVMPLYERDIKQRWGGGRYVVTIKGSHPKSGQPGHILEEVTVDIAGPPKDDDEEEPQRRRRGNLYDRVIGAMDPNPYSRHHQQQQPQQPQQDNAATMAVQTLRDVLIGSTSSKDRDQLIELLKDPKRGGLDAGTVNSIIDANEAHKAATQARHESQMTELREQLTRDMERATSRLERQLEDERATRNRSEENWQRREDQMRERYESEIRRLSTQLEDERNENKRVLQRSDEQHRDEIKRIENQAQQRIEQAQRDAQNAIDRARDEAKTTVDRMVADHRSQLQLLTNTQNEELKRVRHDLESRVAAAEKGKEDAIKMLEESKRNELTIERERSKMLAEQAQYNAKIQVDSATKQAESVAENMKQLMQLNQKASEAQTELMVKQSEFQLRSEQENRQRAENEANRLRRKADEAQDPITALSKYKEVVDTVGSFFNSSETGIVPAGEEKDTSIWGRLERMMDSRFGQRAGEVAGAVLGSAMQRMQQGSQQRQQPPAMPTPRPQMPPPQQMPQPQQMPPPQQMPQAQAQAPPSPAAIGSVEEQIEAALGNTRAAPPPPPQEGHAYPGYNTPPPQAPAESPESHAYPGYNTPPPRETGGFKERIARWVAAVEDHIEKGSPPEAVASTLAQDLPPEQIQALAEAEIEEIVREIEAFDIPTRGVFGSEQGIAYLKQVQAQVRQAITAAQQAMAAGQL